MNNLHTKNLQQKNNIFAKKHWPNVFHEAFLKSQEHEDHVVMYYTLLNSKTFFTFIGTLIFTMY